MQGQNVANRRAALFTAVTFLKNSHTGVSFGVPHWFAFGRRKPVAINRRAQTAQAHAGSPVLDHLEHGQTVGDIINDGIVEG